MSLFDCPDPMPLRAASLWEPWATLSAMGLKPIETRKRPIGLRVGETFVIHAARTYVEPNLYNEVVWAAGLPLGSFPASPGCFVGVARCVAMAVSEEGIPAAWMPAIRGDEARALALGDFRAGRTLYLLDRQQRLLKPVEARGFQGLFGLRSDLEAAVRAQLPLPIEDA